MSSSGPAAARRCGGCPRQGQDIKQRCPQCREAGITEGAYFCSKVRCMFWSNGIGQSDACSTNLRLILTLSNDSLTHASIHTFDESPIQPTLPTNQPTIQSTNQSAGVLQTRLADAQAAAPKKKEAKGKEAKPSPPASGRTAEQQAHDLGMTRALAMLSSELGELGLDVESAFRNPEFLAAAASFANK